MSPDDSSEKGLEIPLLQIAQNPRRIVVRALSPISRFERKAPLIGKRGDAGCRGKVLIAASPRIARHFFLAQPFEEFFPHQLAINSISLLEIRLGHVARVSNLPFHHRDPFDRLLTAQSLTEGIPLLSDDEALDAYGLERIW